MLYALHFVSTIRACINNIWPGLYWDTDSDANLDSAWDLLYICQKVNPFYERERERIKWKVYIFLLQLSLSVYVSVSGVEQKKNLNPIVFMLLCTCLATNASDDLQSQKQTWTKYQSKFETYVPTITNPIMCSYFYLWNVIRFFSHDSKLPFAFGMYHSLSKVYFYHNCFQSLRIEFIVNICKIRYADKYSVWWILNWAA